MMQEDLYDLLEFAYREAKTGTVHIFGKTEDERRHYYVIMLEQGRVCYLGLSSRPEPIPLSQLLALEILNVCFTQNRRKWSTEKPAPFAATILTEIKQNGRFHQSCQRSSQPLKRQAPPPVKLNLGFEAAQLLRLLVGAQAFTQVAQVSRNYPPDQAPVEFVDGCVEHASKIIGPDKARALFYSLYAYLGLKAL
ncbi:MAG: hypothetical protein AAF614_26400 [Chloroflexota bacterium]